MKKEKIVIDEQVIKACSELAQNNLSFILAHYFSATGKSPESASSKDLEELKKSTIFLQNMSLEILKSSTEGDYLVRLIENSHNPRQKFEQIRPLILEQIQFAVSRYITEVF